MFSAVAFRKSIQVVGSRGVKKGRRRTLRRRAAVWRSGSAPHGSGGGGPAETLETNGSSFSAKSRLRQHFRNFRRLPFGLSESVVRLVWTSNGLPTMNAGVSMISPRHRVGVLGRYAGTDQLELIDPWSTNDFSPCRSFSWLGSFGISHRTAPWYPAVGMVGVRRPAPAAAFVMGHSGSSCTMSRRAWTRTFDC